MANLPVLIKTCDEGSGAGDLRFAASTDDQQGLGSSHVRIGGNHLVQRLRDRTRINLEISNNKSAFRHLSRMAGSSRAMSSPS